MRWLKILGWVIGGIAVLVAAAAGTLWFGGGPVIAWAVEHPLAAYLDRQIRIDGPLTVHWGAPTRIIAENVHVANASWGSAPDMFSAKRLEIDIFARSLLRGPARIPLVALDGAKLLLEKSPQGEGNWHFSLASAAPKKRHQFPNLERFTVHQSELIWHNGRTGAQTRLGIDDLSYAAPGADTPVYVKGSGSLAGSFAALPVRVSSTLGPLRELRNPTKPYPVKFNGAIGQVDLAIDGTVDRPLDFDGVKLRVSLSGRKLGELASVLGVPMPVLPDFRGTSELTGGNGNWTLSALTIALGNSNLTGGLAIDTNRKVPYVRANLTSSRIDLADFKGLAGGTPEHASAAAKPAESSDRIFSNTPLNVHKLPGLDADLTFYGTRITSTGGLPFDRVSLDLKLANGTITVDPLRFHAAQGDFDLRLHFTPFTQTSPPRLGAEVDLRHVDLHQLLRTSSSAILRETAGIVGGFVKLDTTGTSMRDFMARMKGDAGIFMQNGQISALLQELTPINVLTSLGIYATGDRPLPINCLVMRFGIEKGVATASTLLFDTADTIVTGAGNLNFADETVNLRLAPANKYFRPVSLRTPIDIGGTFAHRTYHIETGGVIARLGAAIGLGVLFPPAALLPLIDTGLGPDNACAKAYAVQEPPGNPAPKAGSSTAR